jgi:hypothetical protein
MLPDVINGRRRSSSELTSVTSAKFAVIESLLCDQIDPVLPDASSAVPELGVAVTAERTAPVATIRRPPPRRCESDHKIANDTWRDGARQQARDVPDAQGHVNESST